MHNVLPMTNAEETSGAPSESIDQRRVLHEARVDSTALIEASRSLNVTVFLLSTFFIFTILIRQTQRGPVLQLIASTLTVQPLLRFF